MYNYKRIAIIGISSFLLTLIALLVPIVAGKKVHAIQKASRIDTMTVFYAGGKAFVVPTGVGDSAYPWWANGLPINYIGWSDCLAGCVAQFSAGRFAADSIFWFSLSFFLFTNLKRRKPR